MNAFDILDAIGTVDDWYIKRAKEKKRKKVIWITLSSVAACLVLVLGMSIMVSTLFRAGSAEPEIEHAPDYIYAVVDIWSTENRVNYAARENIEPIVDWLDKIASLKLGRNVNCDFEVKPQPGEYKIVLTHHDGQEMEYRLCANKLYDINEGLEYELTEEEIKEFEELLKGGQR